MYCPSNITNIQQVFKSISAQLNQTEKHIKYLYFDYTERSEEQNNLVLSDSSFWNITFDYFYGDNIKLISNNAFGQAANTVNFIQSERYATDTFVNHSPPSYDIWKVLSSFINVKYLFFLFKYYRNTITSIYAIEGKTIKIQ